MEENMTQMEMLEKIAELDYSQSHLRDLNTKMRSWLDLADEEMAVLRAENTALSQQVKTLEKLLSDFQQDDAEPCRSPLDDDLNAQKSSEKKIQALEKESTSLKEQNKKLTTELKSLTQDRDRDKVSLSRFRDELRCLEFRLEKAQLGLEHRDELIHQMNLQLKHSEETAEECSVIMKDLRLMNQEVKRQLEDRLEEASLATLNDAVRGKQGQLSVPLSLAEEIKLLTCSIGVQTSISDFIHLTHNENDAEELLMPQSPTINTETKSCSGFMKTAVCGAALSLLFIVILTFLAFVASGNFAGNFNSIISWADARLMLQSYWSVQYTALPPI